MLALLNECQPPSELCSLTLPPSQETDPIQNYRIIDSHPICDSLESLQVLNSTMFARAILEMKDKTNFSSIGQTRDQTVSPSPYTKFTDQSVRHQRFVTALMSLAFEGFKSYISHEANKKLIKGIKIIMKNQKITNKRITTVKNDMLGLAQATLHDLNELQDKLESTNAGTDYLANRLINAETNL